MAAAHAIPFPTRRAAREGDVLGGKYVLARHIGAGSMGSVFAAVHRDLQMPVAVKVLTFDRDSDEAEARFQREVRAVARLRSEHAVRVMDIGRTESGSPYMVMEYVDGVDLDQILVQRGALRVADAIELALQACEAVSEAHAAGIVHRDLKPRNMMLCRRIDGSPLLKLVDFGVAKLTAGLEAHPGSAMTVTTSLLGSPEYMSPEQISAPRDVDARADIWALGVTLYEMLSGKMPFRGDNLPAILASVLRDEPPPLREVAPHVPAKLEAIVMACLRKSPDERFQSVFELGRALEPFVDWDDTKASTPPPRESGSRLKRAAAFLFAGLVCGVALGCLYNHEARSGAFEEAVRVASAW
jgi:serine/threonine-protein kinase